MTIMPLCINVLITGPSVSYNTERMCGVNKNHPALRPCIHVILTLVVNPILAIDKAVLLLSTAMYTLAVPRLIYSYELILSLKQSYN